MNLPEKFVISEETVGDIMSAPYVYEKRYKGIQAGDTLFCVKGSSEYWIFTEGKDYIVKELRPPSGWNEKYPEIVIFDDEGKESYMQIGSVVSGYFCLKNLINNFLRSKKLEKINNI